MRGRPDGKPVAVLACDGVDRRELTGPREALEAVGAQVELIAPMRGEIHTVEHLERPARRPSIAPSSTPTQ